MANTKGEKELRRHWPVTSGLTAGTTKQEGRTSNLVAKSTRVAQRHTVGIR